MLLKYRPEDKAAKKERLLKRAQAEAEGKASDAKKPIVVKYGLKHVTYLVEQVFIVLFFYTLLVFCSVSLLVVLAVAHRNYFLQNKAQLVVIAHDVDPIELVVWLPALCRKMEIPYCIVKGKSRLGAVSFPLCGAFLEAFIVARTDVIHTLSQIVHKKTASVLCLTSVKNEDKLEFSKVLEAIKVIHNFLQVVQVMIL